ncbi:MAG: hypothetical protein LBG87_02920 [Spirochaetaceae bacterium]|jgi:hypothetical protein|nr:hypothetical protein [Spirochaetaceae bacterium]
MKLAYGFIAGFAAIIAAIGITTACPSGGDSGDPSLEGVASIMGTPVYGGTFFTDTSRLNGNGKYHYAWYYGDNPPIAISGNDSPYYTIQVPSDVGKRIGVTITCDGYTGSVTGGLTSIIASNNSPSAGGGGVLPA